LILYSNLPITCQGVNKLNEPKNCWITFDIKSSEDIAMTQRQPNRTNTTEIMEICSYRLYERDWKPDEGFAYDNESSLDIVAKVGVDL